ncbi:MAG TPA: glycoside hydrolase family 2 TIM barrel-domain containing protein [Sphingobacteriaceae bacterium]|nr:glycoside hydrolase family 2 TIM barrel-domain containing protein [Sphingobacteriaceae bacterium]
MKKIVILHLLLLVTSISSIAEEVQLFRMTPFTGTDYVRLVVDEKFRFSPTNTFKVVIRTNNGNIFWEGPVIAVSAPGHGKNNLAFTIKGLKPILWEPNNPYLYHITLQQFSGKVEKAKVIERVGFRSFERRMGTLYLNGKPIFLRGIAINPPGRGIPDKLERSREFAMDYVKYMKSINVNIIRIPSEEAWFDVCDELGMMVFGGNYGGKAGQGEKVAKVEAVGDETDGGFPTDYDRGVKWYEDDKLGPIAHHPSLMIYAMTNETPFVGERAVQWEKFLDYAYNKLKQWDETRVYIANAGYGYGKTGDIIDIHRYWGWYYSSPFTFLNIRDNSKIIPFPKNNMPITFTECVGNYTGPDGRYNLTPWHKNPSSQLAWTGHERQDLQSRMADEHQTLTIRSATELFRQLRSVNHDLSGVFPFTILFYNWDTIKKFEDMNPKPAANQVKISYQPVLLSWECWTPNIYAGSTLKPVAHVINDANDFSDLKNAKLIYQIRDKAHTVVFADSTDLPDVPYYGTTQKKLDIKLPQNISSGQYELTGKVMKGGKAVSQNYFKLFIANRTFTEGMSSPAMNILLYDKLGVTKSSLSKLNVKFKEISSFNAISTNSFLIIGENSADQTVSGQAENIKSFIRSGGRVLALKQDSIHRVSLNFLLANPLSNHIVDIDHPAYPVSSKSPRNGYYVNPERPEHRLFAGITRYNLRTWSDYTDWNPRKNGLPAITPVTDGFTLENKEDIAHTAILANYGSGLQGVALAEQFHGKGSILLCGLDLSNRTGIDPVATRMMLNLVNYTGSAAGHERYPLITSPIIWGEYETEKGVVTDLYSGFLVNSTPRMPSDYVGKGIIVTKEGYQLAGGSRAAFNTRPGIQYVANGRRPFGPYAQTFGGQPAPDKNSTFGTAQFWCRVPAGTNVMSTLAWNPGKEDLELKIRVNDLSELTTKIKAGEKMIITNPVNSTDINVVYTSDRRIVILETSFR